MVATPVMFSDPPPGGTGTTQNAATLNVAVPAASYRMQGTDPSTSGTLTLTIAQQQAVIRNSAGTSAVYVNANATTATMTDGSGGRDNYVDLTTAGGYTVSAVTVGAAQPAQADNTLRLWKVTTNGGGSISTVALMPGVTAPISPAMVQHGVRQETATAQLAFGTTTSWQNAAPSITLTATLGGAFHIRLTGLMVSQGGLWTSVAAQVVISGGASGSVPFSTITVPPDINANGLTHAQVPYVSELGYTGTAGSAYTFQPQVQAGGTSGPYPTFITNLFEVEEVA